jgi:uncharacterized lipoprotein YddW (UPF0748 family)
MPNLKATWLLLVLALTLCGCVGATEKYPSDQAKEFFQAANEAKFRGVWCQSPERIDLSAYTPYMGVKYPPTTSVEVLSAPPSRPYQCFAVLEGARAAAARPGTVAPEALAQFTAKAKDIGADAIILRFPPEAVGAHRSARMEALAIKYRLENLRRQ